EPSTTRIADPAGMALTRILSDWRKASGDCGIVTTLGPRVERALELWVRREQGRRVRGHQELDLRWSAQIHQVVNQRVLPKHVQGNLGLINDKQRASVGAKENLVGENKQLLLAGT